VNIFISLPLRPPIVDRDPGDENPTIPYFRFAKDLWFRDDIWPRRREARRWDGAPPIVDRDPGDE
jgi:hypothetical protein